MHLAVEGLELLPLGLRGEERPCLLVQVGLHVHRSVGPVLLVLGSDVGQVARAHIHLVLGNLVSFVVVDGGLSIAGPHRLLLAGAIFSLLWLLQLSVIGRHAVFSIIVEVPFRFEVDFAVVGAEAHQSVLNLLRLGVLPHEILLVEGRRHVLHSVADSHVLLLSLEEALLGEGRDAAQGAPLSLVFFGPPEGGPSILELAKQFEIFLGDAVVLFVELVDEGLGLGLLDLFEVGSTIAVISELGLALLVDLHEFLLVLLVHAG